MKGLNIGIIYNKLPGGDCDKTLYDDPETIEAIITALESSGNREIELPLSRSLIDDLPKQASRLEFVINLSMAQEMGRLRQGFIPAILEYNQIPFLGSDSLTLSISQDKFLTNELLDQSLINIPSYQRFRSKDEELAPGLDFPLIVKPIRESTSRGISEASYVQNGRELRNEVDHVLREHNQEALVQEFIDGNEYTVGIIGNVILPILEIDMGSIPNQPKVRDSRVKKIDNEYTRLASLEEKTYKALAAQAFYSHQAIDCLDLSRVDFRERNGEFYFLEINPQPGLETSDQVKKYSHLPLMANLAGLEYPQFINLLVFNSMNRNKERFNAQKLENLEEFLSGVDAVFRDSDHVGQNSFYLSTAKVPYESPALVRGR